MTTIDLIPPNRAIRRTYKLCNGQHSGALTEESFALGAIRSLLTGADDRPIRIVGVCGYGRWGKSSRKGA